MLSRLDQHLKKKQGRPKYRAMAVGNFENEERTVWSENTKAYGSVKDFIRDVGTSDPYYEFLAEELHVKIEELPAFLETHDAAPEMCSLIKVLLAVRYNIAIKGFKKYRDAENFISLLEQLDFEAPPDPETESLFRDIPTSWVTRLRPQRSRFLNPYWKEFF